MPDIVVLCLFGGGAFFAALGAFLRKKSALWALFSALCVFAGLLSGLALGKTLKELVPPLALVCAVSLAALVYGKGGADG